MKSKIWSLSRVNEKHIPLILVISCPLSLSLYWPRLLRVRRDSKNIKQLVVPTRQWFHSCQQVNKGIPNLHGPAATYKSTILQVRAEDGSFIITMVACDTIHLGKRCGRSWNFTSLSNYHVAVVIFSSLAASYCSRNTLVFLEDLRSQISQHWNDSKQNCAKLNVRVLEFHNCSGVSNRFEQGWSYACACCCSMQ